MVFWRLCSAAVILVGLFAFACFSIPAWDRYRGQPVTVLVDSRNSSASGRSGTKRYVNYHYPWHGRMIDGRTEIDSDAYKRVKKNQPLTARVVGWRDWSWCVITQPGYEDDVWPAPIVTLLVESVWALLGYWVWRIFQVQKRLVQIGTAVGGVVTGKKVNSNAKSTSYTVSYRYQPPAGPEYDASQRLDGKGYAAAVIGSAVTVLFDPARPERSIVYELSYYQADGARV